MCWVYVHFYRAAFNLAILCIMTITAFNFNFSPHVSWARAGGLKQRDSLSRSHLVWPHPETCHIRNTKTSLCQVRMNFLTALLHDVMKPYRGSVNKNISWQIKVTFQIWRVSVCWYFCYSYIYSHVEKNPPHQFLSVTYKYNTLACNTIWNNQRGGIWSHSCFSSLKFVGIHSRTAFQSVWCLHFNRVTAAPWFWWFLVFLFGRKVQTPIYQERLLW